jgi:hypothetical protein
MFSMLTAASLTLFFLGVVVGLGAALVWGIWEIEQKCKPRRNSASIRASAERAAAARKEVDRLACEAWNQRMLGYRGPAQPSPTLGDALNAG